MIMAADEKKYEPLTPERFTIIQGLTIMVDWNNRVVQVRERSQGPLIIAKPTVMLIPIDDLMLVAAQVLQLQSQHNKSILAAAQQANVLKHQALGQNGEKA